MGFRRPFYVITLLLLLALFALPNAHAQRRVRPAFEPTLVRRMTVAGTVRFKIVPRTDGLSHEFAPIGYGGWTAVVRIDGHIVGSLKQLPGVIPWDTRASGDGIHEVLVSVRHAASDNEVRVEGAQVIVDNAAADNAAEAAELARAAERSAFGLRDFDADSPLRTIPETAIITRPTPRLSSSRELRTARATALLRRGEQLYIGLPDGGIAYTSPESPASRGGMLGSVVRLPFAESPARALVSGGGRIWWITESGRTVYAFDAAARSLIRYDTTAALTTPPPTVVEPLLPQWETPEFSVAPPKPVSLPSKPTGWVRRLAVLRGKILLLGDAGAVRVLEPRTGKLTDAADIAGLLPDNLLHGDDSTTQRMSRIASLFVASTGDTPDASALLAVVTPSPLPLTAPFATDTLSPINEHTSVNFGPNISSPSAFPRGSNRWRRYQVQTWRSGRDRLWRTGTAFATDAHPERALRLAVSPNAVATAEREGPRFVAESTVDIPYSLSPGMPSSTDKIAVSPSGLWWEQRGIVFHADPKTGMREVYLPWNVDGGTGAVLALHADNNGIWVATTSAGIRYIRPGRPSPVDGYNGYVRARLGSDTLQPPTPRDDRIAAAIAIWQGTRYVWGGQSRSGTDCSGFVMRMHGIAGVSIPRTSMQMRHSSKGRRVRDELRWGDTLVFPGHCALYIGDGRTAETVGGSRGGSVSYSSIWIRSNVVVRRFLK